MVARPDESARPLQRVWNPFLTQMIVFGKHLDDNHVHIHKIMQVADVISQDCATKLPAGWGTEGEHSVIPEGETAPQSRPAINALYLPVRRVGSITRDWSRPVPTSRRWRRSVHRRG